VGETVLEGFIDLLFEEESGLVVVDYKTDVLETEEEVAKRAVHYRLQGGAYALAVQAATWRPVKEVIFLFLHPKGEALVQDLPAAIADAEQAALFQGKSEALA
jgi:ATP-dependent helicase/nuclease subunit A